MKLKLLRSENVIDNVRSFIFEPEKPLSWEPGQYMHYVLPHKDEDDRGHERWFTISAAPFENHIMISTRINKDRSSSFKHALQTMRPGDEIEADGPEGDFVVDDPTRNYIFVAGGIGITPFRSILQEAEAKGTNLKVSLLYANSSPEIPFKDELDQLAAKNSNLKIEYIVSPSRIDKQLLKQHIDAVENPFVYVSGPKPMVEDFSKLLAELGLQKENIKTDDFPGYKVY
jgi:ferredoxin-NADP reductase